MSRFDNKKLQEQFEDTKVVTRRRSPKENEHYNGQIKEDKWINNYLQSITQEIEQNEHH